MGTVCREGDWRLEERDDGVYEVTHDRQPELKIIIGDYEPSKSTDGHTDPDVQTREVESVSESEELFDEMTEAFPSTGGGPEATVLSGDSDNVDSIGNLDGRLSTGVENDDSPAFPPVGILLVGVAVSGVLIQQSGFDVGSPIYLIGVAVLSLPVGVLGLTYRVYRREGTGAAADYLVTGQTD